MHHRLAIMIALAAGLAAFAKWPSHYPFELEDLYYIGSPSEGPAYPDTGVVNGETFLNYSDREVAAAESYQLYDLDLKQGLLAPSRFPKPVDALLTIPLRSLWLDPAGATVNLERLQRTAR